ncbi:MAG: BrnT family toxin [Bacteroidales bacterium]|nr:BrnT family toxin [Bacteroidales bacterium]
MPFEFDNLKSKANKVKHGMDFIEAQELWEDIDRLIIPVRNVDDPRFLILGKRDNKIWSGIFTMRNENIRIITVRRARKEEIAIYES